jgi:hypothetical protein
MAELELDFLRVVEAQAVVAWPTSSASSPTSSASSPTSDVGLMENFADDIDSSTDGEIFEVYISALHLITCTIAWLEQVKLRFR